MQSGYLTLSDLLGAVKTALDDGFGRRSFRILVQITDVKIYYQRQYAFMTLIEKQEGEVIAAAGAAIWRDAFGCIQRFEKATGVRLEQNPELILEVQVQFNVRYGLRFSILNIDETYTLGKLEQEKKNVINQLLTQYPSYVWMQNEVLASANQRLKWPMVCKNIALISAPGSDGRRDFLHELENNEYSIGYSVQEFPAQVQGEVASLQIAAQLQKINTIKSGIQAVALVRGGGGNNDFSAFDSAEVALEIARCKFPVVTGIGHERNVSLADTLAHTSAKTPTKSASFFTERNTGFIAFLQQSAPEIKRRGMRMVELEREKINVAGDRIRKSLLWSIAGQKQFVQRVESGIRVADPGNTLERGFAVVKMQGKHVLLAEQLKSGDKIEINFTDGNRTAITE